MILLAENFAERTENDTTFNDSDRSRQPKLELNSCWENHWILKHDKKDQHSISYYAVCTHANAIIASEVRSDNAIGLHYMCVYVCVRAHYSAILITFQLCSLHRCVRSLRIEHLYLIPFHFISFLIVCRFVFLLFCFGVNGYYYIVSVGRSCVRQIQHAISYCMASVMSFDEIEEDRK